MKNLEQVIQYLDGELNEAEKQQLVEKLRKDPDLNDQLNLVKDVDMLLGDKQLATFEASLKEIEAAHLNHTPQTERSSKTGRFWLQIAASAIVIVSVTAYILLQNNKSDLSNDLYTTYYQKLPADFATRSADDSNDSFINAIRLYNENKYQEAIAEFDKVLKTDPMNNAARLFQGICFTETNNFAKASQQFYSIIKQRDPIFEEHAAWYLSLCLIKTHDIEKARPLLTNLVESRSYYMGKATELLKKLK